MEKRKMEERQDIFFQHQSIFSHPVLDRDDLLNEIGILSSLSHMLNKVYLSEQDEQDEQM